jgi:hypothetical protein
MMKRSITEEIISLVFRSDPDLCARLKTLKQQLDRTACSDPAIGRWILANGLDYLVAAFNLSDPEFATRYPELPSSTRIGRKHLIRSFKQHAATCPHCSLAHQLDLALDQQIDQAMRENRESLLEMLADDEATETPTDHTPELAGVR